MSCPRCNSNDWDHANVGLPSALVCLDCGHIYSTGNKKMTESEFEAKFDNGDLDCAFAEFLFDRYDASNEHKLEVLWEDLGAYEDFKYFMVNEPSKSLQNAYFGGSNPLDSFPTIRGDLE